jgi:cytochrome c556
MNRRWRQIVCSMLVLTLAAGALLAQVKKGKTRPTPTSTLMKCVMKPSCDALKAGLDKGPADDKAWGVMGLHAGLINELSYSLMEDGRCPDGVWANAASKTLRDNSADLMKAADEKNLDNARGSFKAMTGACAACHKAHRETK